MFTEKPEREEVLNWIREEIALINEELTDTRMWLVATYQVILELQEEVRKSKGERRGETFESTN